MIRLIRCAFCAVLAALPGTASSQELQTLAFSYQGRLSQSGVPVQGSRAMIFRLYDAASDGIQEGEISLPAVAIDDGLFVVELDFDDGVFVGQQLWLEVEIEGDILQPRQRIASTPYALYALTGNEGPPGPPGDAGSANITGTSGQLVRFSSETSGSDSIISDDGSTVTIGGASQITKLTVDGGLRLDSTNPSLQFGSTRTLSFPGNSTFVGRNSGGASLEVDNSSSNTAVGESTLLELSNGASNTAIGRRSMVQLTSGNSNIGVGSRALAHLTSGNRNIALGADSGLNVVSGSNNVYIATNATSPDESGTIRIGSTILHSNAYIAGIHGTMPAGVLQNVVVNSNGHLGSAPVPPSPPRILYGRLNADCTIVNGGGGYSTSQLEPGVCRISFASSFSASPSVTATPYIAATRGIVVQAVGNGSTDIRSFNTSTGATGSWAFLFQIIGP